MNKTAIKFDELNGEEQEDFLRKFRLSLWEETTPEAEAFFAERKKLGLGVGLDNEGNLIYQKPEN